MLFWQKNMIAERAALNGIDIGRYSAMPQETVWAILDAIEDGCPQRVIANLAAGNPQALQRYLDGHKQEDDIKAFADSLTDNKAGRILKAPPDLAGQIRKWDFILPDDSYLGWSSEYVRFNNEKLQRYVDEKDPLPNRDTPFILAAERLVNGEDGEFLEMADDESIRIFGEHGTGRGLKTAEYVCCYLALSDIPLRESLEFGGKAALALGVDRRGIYKCMLEAASLIKTLTDGPLAAQAFYNRHKSGVRYRIVKTGFLKKKLIAEELPDKGRLFLNIFEALKKPGNGLETLAGAGAGHAELVLWHAVFAQGKDGILADREKLQYADELCRYIMSSHKSNRDKQKGGER